MSSAQCVMNPNMNALSFSLFAFSIVSNIISFAALPFLPWRYSDIFSVFLL
jgi:hypothetical protein